MERKTGNFGVFLLETEHCNKYKLTLTERMEYYYEMAHD